jgi:group I intron endonuclease
MSCVYIATNTTNGKQYVGQTINFDRRIQEHKRNHSNYYFDNSIQNYGVESFNFVKIEYSQDVLNYWEQYWIQELGTLYPNGYNLTTGGNVFTVTEVTKQKLRECHKRENLSPETIQKISEAAKQLRHTAETKKKISESMKKNYQEGRREAVAVLGSTWVKGSKHTDEAKKKMRDAHKRNGMSEAHRLAIIASNKRRAKRPESEKGDGED